MKVLHRIRGYLIVLLFMLHCSIAASPPAPDFKDCEEKNAICLVHMTSCILITGDFYQQFDKTNIKVDQCKRYMIIRAKSIETVEIEFRDDTFKKNEGVTIQTSDNNDLFKCNANKATSPDDPQIVSLTPTDSSAGNYDKLYCKFELSSKEATKNIARYLSNHNPVRIKTHQGAFISIKGVDFAPITMCDWSNRLFTTQYTYDATDDNESERLIIPPDFSTQRKCPADYFFEYKEGSQPWEKKSKEDNFFCSKGEIKITKVGGGSAVVNLQDGQTKCTRPKCAACSKCKNCVVPTPSDKCSEVPQFIESDGESCAMITCPNCKGMEIDSGSAAAFIHPNISLTCSKEKKWKYTDIETKNVRCLEEILCSKLHPILTECPTTLPEGKKCAVADLNDVGKEVCAGVDVETWYTTNAEKIPRQVTEIKCNQMSGEWQDEKGGEIKTNSTVFCLSKEDKNRAAPSTGSIPAGTLIGAIIGGGLAVGIIVAIAVLCLKRKLKKKGNRDEMRSVSVTGKGDRKSKKKKGSSSNTSKTSEVSAPPPPPCPDSLSFNVEPEPPARPTQPASGPAPVGPDTGKPDKPAELIDINSINMVSEKKNDSKKDGAQEATVVNTVTGTDSKAEPAKKDATETTKKMDKNGESAKSDTGRISKAEGGKKKRNKDMKVTLDKNGRGLTDDDDFNIDEGGKPVNHVDKSRRPYKPAVDPRKKMINVTMTEDEDGNAKPKANKNSMF